MQGDVSAMDETKVFENETDAEQVDASNVQLSIRKNENLDINRERVGQDVRNEMNDQNDFKEAAVFKNTKHHQETQTEPIFYKWVMTLKRNEAL